MKSITRITIDHLKRKPPKAETKYYPLDAGEVYLLRVAGIEIRALPDNTDRIYIRGLT